MTLNTSVVDPGPPRVHDEDEVEHANTVDQADQHDDHDHRSDQRHHDIHTSANLVYFGSFMVEPPHSNGA